MSNLTITGASAGLSNSDVEFDSIILGETFTHTMPFYINSSDNKAYKAIASDTIAKSRAKGIIITPGASGDKAIYVRAGKMKPGAALVKGKMYVVSATSGLICPVDDLVSTNYVTYLAYADSTSTWIVNIVDTGVTL